MIFGFFVNFLLDKKYVDDNNDEFSASKSQQTMSICCMLKVKNVNFFLDETKSFFMAKLNENSVT